ncbi:MAG: hypothetical protein JWN56_2004 [Sphingobacteriales bacterium]|nr:hypothetical protein [Sphingobacteriales bacterium]
MKIQEQTYNRFISQHQLIKNYIDNLPPKAINERLFSNKRSIHETIAFLCRYQYVFMERLNAILTNVNPVFERYDQAHDGEFNNTLARSTGALLHEIYRVRDEMKLMIDKLSPEQCCRMGTHVKMGTMNICEWMEFFLLQESKHLYKIFKMAGAFGAQLSNNINIKTSSKVAFSKLNGQS